MKKWLLSTTTQSLSFGSLRNSRQFFTFFRKKSTIVMPLSYMSEVLTDADEVKISRHQETRDDFDRMLTKYLTHGKEKMSEHLYIESLRDFDAVIASASGESTNKLTSDQIDLIAQAYMYKAEILSYGSTNDIKMAIANIDRALELNPRLKVATKLKESIKAEWPVQQTTDSDDLDYGKKVLTKT